MMKFKAIPTKYNGLQFRSRLEAQWAAFFDLLGWNWEYEPYDLDGYIPDFVLIFKHDNILVEVKPDTKIDDLKKYEKKIIDSGYTGKYLIVGSTLFGLHGIYTTIKSNYDDVILGLFNSTIKCHEDDNDFIITKCQTCNNLTLCSESMTWICYMCGEYGKKVRGDIRMMDIIPLWHEAKNIVQYVNKK